MKAETVVIMETDAVIIAENKKRNQYSLPGSKKRSGSFRVPPLLFSCNRLSSADSDPEQDSQNRQYLPDFQPGGMIHDPYFMCSGFQRHSEKRRVRFLVFYNFSIHIYFKIFIIWNGCDHISFSRCIHGACDHVPFRLVF